MQKLITLFLLCPLLISSEVLARETNARWRFSFRNKKVLAEKVSFGGLCTNCVKTQTQILSDGRVRLIKTPYGADEVNPHAPNNGDKKSVIIDLFKLEKSFLKKLKKGLQSFPKTMPLENPYPELPSCADIPEVHYSIFRKGDGDKWEALKIGEDKFCHTFRARDFKGIKIIDLLNSVRSFEKYLDKPPKEENPVEPVPAPGGDDTNPTPAPLPGSTTDPSTGPEPSPVPEPNPGPGPITPVVPPTDGDTAFL